MRELGRYAFTLAAAGALCVAAARCSPSEALVGGPDAGPTPDSGATPVDSGTPGTPDSGSTTTPDGGTHPSPDAGSTGACVPNRGPANVPFDSGIPGYPASHLAPALQLYGCDRLLLNPKIVTVTFPNDANATAYETLGDSLTATTWWDQVTRGYCDGQGNCIGRGMGGGHVELTTAPAGSYTDTPATDGGASTIKDFITQQVGNGTFPMPDNNTLYVIYFPWNVTINLANGNQTAQSCLAFGGYHSQVPITTPSGVVHAAYAIVPECLFPTIPVTEAMSHEVIEATTDPLVSDVTANGWYMDQSRDAWQAVSAAEVGDACALLLDFAALINPTSKPEQYLESGTIVQRSWSNASLLAGQDPCVPVQSSLYFNVAPSVEKLVMSTFGQKQTIQITGFSNQPTSDWQVKVLDFGFLTSLKTTLGLAFADGGTVATLNNGTVVDLTVTVNGTIDPDAGAPFVLVSYTPNGNFFSYWPGIVEVQ